MAKRLIQSTTIPSGLKTYDMHDEKTVEAQDGSTLRFNRYYSGQFLTVNCAPLEKTNLRAVGGMFVNAFAKVKKQSHKGVVHTTTKPVVGAKQSLWELIGSNTELSEFASRTFSTFFCSQSVTFRPLQSSALIGKTSS